MRILTLILGSVILLVGVVHFISPIPGGTFVIALGASMILCNSKTAARYLKKYRSGSERLNRAIIWLETKIGDRFNGPLKVTRPDTDNPTQKS